MKKFHATLDNKISVCGLVKNKPDTYLYNRQRFFNHSATLHRCKKCEAALIKSWSNN